MAISICQLATSSALVMRYPTHWSYPEQSHEQLADERNGQILELYQRCWTEQQIAKEVGLKQPQVHSLIIGFCENAQNSVMLL